MASNIDVTPGSGKTVATDEVSGKQYQMIKQGFGAAGAYTLAVGGTGTVNSGVQRVTLATDVALPTGANVIGSVAQSGIWSFSPILSNTATITSVPDNAASVTILASNANRVGASVINDSSATLLLCMGAGPASATNYTVRLPQYSYYEVPYSFTGQLTGIWETDPGDGAARVTEFT
jgi:hypothetical protein